MGKEANFFRYSKLYTWFFSIFFLFIFVLSTRREGQAANEGFTY